MDSKTKLQAKFNSYILAS